MSPVEIVLLASNAPIKRTLPPEPTTSGVAVKCVIIKTCVIVLLPLVASGNSIELEFLQVCVSADSAVNVHAEAATCCLA